MNNTQFAANATYTLAQVTEHGPKAIKGIPCNMTKEQAEVMAQKAITMKAAHNMDIVAYNVGAL